MARCSKAKRVARIVGQVRGPDGRMWATTGVPSKYGSLLLQLAHVLLITLLLLNLRKGKAEKSCEDSSVDVSSDGTVLRSCLPRECLPVMQGPSAAHQPVSSVSSVYDWPHAL